MSLRRVVDSSNRSSRTYRFPNEPNVRQYGNGQEEPNQDQVSKQVWSYQCHPNGIMNVTTNVHEKQHTHATNGIRVAHQHAGTQSQSTTRYQEGANISADVVAIGESIVALASGGRRRRRRRRTGWSRSHEPLLNVGRKGIAEHGNGQHQ